MSEFLEEKKKDREAEESAKARKPNRIWKLALLGVLSAGAWLYPFPPPSPTRAIPHMVTQAGARMEVFIAAQRVRKYRKEHGRLPNPLSRAGVDEAWLTLQPIDSLEFEITGRTDGVQVSYRSTMSDSVYFHDTRAMLGGSTN